MGTIFVFVLLMSYNLNAQSKFSDSTKLDTIIPVEGIDMENKRSYLIESFKQNEKVYLLYLKLHDNACKGFCLDLKKNTTKAFNLEFKSLETASKRAKIDDFHITNDSIYVLFSEDIFVFPNNTEEQEHIKETHSYKNIGESYGDIHKAGDTIILSCLQKGYHNCVELALFEKSVENNAGTGLLSIFSNNSGTDQSFNLDLKKSIQPRFGMPAFGNYTPYKYIDIDRDNGYIYILSPHTRKVHVYDFNLEFSHSIHFEKENWNQIPPAIAEKISNKNAVSAARSLHKQLDVRNCYTYNERLYYDNGYLYIDTRNVDSSYTHSYDIFKISDKDTTAEKRYSDLRVFSQLKFKDTLTKSNFPLIISNQGRINYWIKDSKIYSLRMDSKTKPLGLTYDKWKEIRKREIIEDQKQLKLYIYEINL